jgi:hypothetical protein
VVHCRLSNTHQSSRVSSQTWPATVKRSQKLIWHDEFFYSLELYSNKVSDTNVFCPESKPTHQKWCIYVLFIYSPKKPPAEGGVKGWNNYSDIRTWVAQGGGVKIIGGVNLSILSGTNTKEDVWRDPKERRSFLVGSRPLDCLLEQIKWGIRGDSWMHEVTLVWQTRVGGYVVW